MGHLAALVLSKFVIGSAVALAAGAMSHAKAGGGLTALVAGAAVMLIAAFTPWVLLRLIPIAEASAHSGMQRGAVTGAMGAAPGAATGSMVVRQAILMAAVPAGAAAASGPAVAAGRPPAVPRVPPAPAVVTDRGRGDA